MAAKDTIKDLRKKDENLVDGAEKAKDPGKLPENTPNVEKLREDEGKTNLPASEAQSHKPTFGEAAERPGTEQAEPEADDSTKAGKDLNNELETLRDEQDIQNNPDAFQQSIHQPTTEDLLRAPERRPVTIDPATGQAHYTGEAASLPGGTIANEGKDA